MRTAPSARWFVSLALLLIALGIGALILRPWASQAPPVAGSPAASPATAVIATATGNASPTPAALPGSASVPGSATRTAPGNAVTSPSSPASPSASAPASSATPRSAPTSAIRFDPLHTVVPMGFPLLASARYRYSALWRVPRVGIVYSYNQIRGVAANGALLRAHDGVDLDVAIGTLLVAPFAGVVVDPVKIWKPWDPQRYGKVVVIQSTEATSRGYYALLVHLSRQSVAIGQTVRREQVVGRSGTSGNAAETTPHLHFELRAPFPIEFHYAGVKRFLDDFDPLPSLRAVDPHL